MMRTKRRETDLFLHSNISNSKSFAEFPPPTMLKWHQGTRSWQNTMLIASIHCYFVGLHQALTVMFSSQGSKVAVFGQSWYQKSGGSVTQIELEFGVNQTDVSPGSCGSAQLNCPVPPRNPWLYLSLACTCAPQAKYLHNLSSFQGQQVLGSSAAATFPQAAGNLFKTCATCGLPAPGKLTTSLAWEEALPLGASFKSSSCLKLFCGATCPLLASGGIFPLPGALWFNTYTG